MTASVHEWKEPPSMDTGAPLPAIRKEEDRLWVAYVCRNSEFPGWGSGARPEHPGFEVWCALLRFDGVLDYHFGAPSDERLHTHPLYATGLSFYGFYEARGTSRLADRKEKKHWIITFHDETLEVVADSAHVVSPKIEGEDTHAALQKRG
jgi:hypothetical protein